MKPSKFICHVIAFTFAFNAIVPANSAYAAISCNGAHPPEAQFDPIYDLRISGEATLLRLKQWSGELEPAEAVKSRHTRFLMERYMAEWMNASAAKLIKAAFLKAEISFLKIKSGSRDPKDFENLAESYGEYIVVRDKLEEIRDSKSHELQEQAQNVLSRVSFLNTLNIKSLGGLEAARPYLEKGLQMVPREELRELYNKHPELIRAKLKVDIHSAKMAVVRKAINVPRLLKLYRAFQLIQQYGLKPMALHTVKLEDKPVNPNPSTISKLATKTTAAVTAPVDAARKAVRLFYDGYMVKEYRPVVERFMEMEQRGVDTKEMLDRLIEENLHTANNELIFNFPRFKYSIKVWEKLLNKAVELSKLDTLEGRRYKQIAETIQVAEKSLVKNGSLSQFVEQGGVDRVYQAIILGISLIGLGDQFKDVLFSGTDDLSNSAADEVNQLFSEDSAGNSSDGASGESRDNVKTGDAPAISGPVQYNQGSED